jgi:hypothetical protein
MTIASKRRKGAKRPTLNREWHAANKMPPKATFEQRVRWHLEHLEACACRGELPAGLAEQMRQRGMKVPPAASR